MTTTTPYYLHPCGGGGGHHNRQLHKFSAIPICPIKQPIIIPFTKPISIPSLSRHCFILITRRNRHINIINATSIPIVPYNNNEDGDGDDHKTNKPQKPQQVHQDQKKSFWGAVSLIIGTAVGPGMLALPAATIKAGPLPSTISILISWVYVISSIILVAELSFATMEEDGVEEVSFTALAIKALGSRFGAFVALIYASLSFSLLVACVSGIGSIVSQWFPLMNFFIAHSLFPFAVGTVIFFFPFTVIDAANRFLCIIMLFSITALVIIGLSVARTSILGSFTHASWSLSSILPAMPVTVLTLGFHVITPFICKIAGNTVTEARKAILFGGAVPLIMVLSWNVIVLGIAGTNTSSSPVNPISMLLSVNPSALSAIQGFAFSALATSLIGYALSFPKQLLDTLELIFGTTNYNDRISSPSQKGICEGGTGRVGFDNYSGDPDLEDAPAVSYIKQGHIPALETEQTPSRLDSSTFKLFVTPLVLGIPVLIASHFPSTFSKALDFAGVYANCFLFGILPPVMTYIYQSRKKLRHLILPGGDGALLLLFGFAVIFGIWH